VRQGVAGEGGGRRVLLVYAELAPWIQTGGLADVAAARLASMRAC